MQVGFIGSGNMARALARGWGDPVLCTDSGSGHAQALVDELGGEALSNEQLAERADVVILAHKPYQLDDVADQAQAARTVVSLLGRTTVQDVQSAYPEANVFRAEPNTPVALRQGVIAFARPAEPTELYAAIKAHFARVGTVLEVPERLMGVVGAISGVGPAYVALLAEAWTDAAVRHGMPAAQAATLVSETMAGSAALLAHQDTLALRRAVASPGGTTARGLDALERGGVRAALSDAMDRVLG